MLAGIAVLAASVFGLGARQAGAAQTDLGVRIDLTEMSPRLVTADGPGVLTVAGRITNRGDRAIRSLDVRVQRGEALGSDADLRTALSGGASTDSARPRFVDLPTELSPGGSTPFRVEIPLRGGGPLDSLHLAGVGVYPLLVNLNGLPDFGGRARIAAVRVLLPVLALPPAGGAPAVAPAPSTAMPLTVLWPLVDVPHRLPRVDDVPVVLRDDSLAASLADGGRLHGLVRAALRAAPAGSELANALCVAVDPDLVDTVRLMAEVGYELPAGAPGAGRQVAAEWLRSLRELVTGRCVLALPMADADLVALSRAGLTDLQGRARTDGAQILRDVLGVRPVTELAWPVDEWLDERTLTDLASLGTDAVLLQPHGLADADRYAGQAVVGLATGSPATASQRGVLVDGVVGRALAGPLSTERAPDEPVTVQPSSTPAGSDAPLSVQDGLAALAYRATGGEQAGVLLAPPRRWSAAEAETTELLRAAGRLIADGWARPRGIGDLTGGAPPQLTATLDYPGQAQAAEVSRPVTAAASGVRDQLRDLEASFKRDPRIGYDPARLLDPMRFNLLRGTSTGWRGDQETARWFVQQSDDRLRELRESVEIVPPAGPYLLAASNSPLLLNLNNPLPVQVDVQITLSSVPGLRTEPIAVIGLPAGSRRQVRVPAEVVRAGQFSVEAQLATPGGTLLGPRGAPSRIQLRSTAYGTVTLVLTGGAAIALVLLAGWRITRRVRAARAAGSGEGS